jgi:cephalosporin-C deacetylase-like acetyl esterase
VRAAIPFFDYRLRRLLLALLCVTLVAADASKKWEQPVDCSSARKNLPPYSELVKAFRYVKVPIAVNVMSDSDDGVLRAQTIEFEADHGQTCSAELIFPDRPGRYPGVVWLGSGDKDWEHHALEFSKLGAVSILPDWCGDSSLTDAHPQYQERVRMIINLRRAVDILASRGDVDPRRIAFVGHSGGTLLGVDAVAVDKRFKAAVFEVGLQGYTYHICTSPIPFAIGVRKQLKDQLLNFATVLAPLDAILYVGHEAPTVLLFQSARLDQAITTADAQAFFDAASEPKQLKWYDTGHKMELPAVTKDRTDFLKQQLRMK